MIKVLTFLIIQNITFIFMGNRHYVKNQNFEQCFVHYLY